MVATDLPFDSVALISHDSFCFLNWRRELIADWVARGVTVYAIGDHSAKGAEQLRQLGAMPVHLRLHPGSANPAIVVASTWRLHRVLRRLKVDATFAYFTKAVVVAGIAARLAKVSRRYAMISGRGYAFTGEARRQRLLRFFIRKGMSSALRHARLVIFENDVDLREFVTEGLVSSRAAVRVAGSGVNIEYFAFTPVPSVARITLIGRLLHEKGIVEFCEASLIVAKQYPDTQFRVVGGVSRNPGSLSAKTVRSLFAEGPVQWVDHVEDVREEIALSSAVVLPSYREGLPRSLLEAMAMGRPLIVSDIPGCRELVAFKNGILVRPRDANDLAQAMLVLVRDRRLSIAMGLASRRLVEARYAVGIVNREITQRIVESR